MIIVVAVALAVQVVRAVDFVDLTDSFKVGFHEGSHVNDIASRGMSGRARAAGAKTEANQRLGGNSDTFLTIGFYAPLLDHHTSLVLDRVTVNPRTQA